GDAILLAEANVAIDKIHDYFGHGDKMHMLFNFILNQHLFLALARKEAAPLIEGLLKLPIIPESCQWANFLRNHDEIDLGRLSESQLDEVLRAFGPQKNMQLYGRGIRRRLAPMLGGDLDRLKMAYSLLLSLPGTPVIRYGEEIGMGEDLSLKERDSIRTPMQWHAGVNGGFSSAPATKLFRPVISKGEFAYDRVNVAVERRDPNSLVNFIERCIRMRKECPEFGRGSWSIIETNQPSVFAHSLHAENGTVAALHNLSDQPCSIRMDVSSLGAQRLIEVLRSHEDLQVKDKTVSLRLRRYDYRWYRVVKKTDN
ncbi:MAG: trehalose synthase, partial [Acidobacteriaceae bacterium]|nr:trehalose synthase [Acidobacteriaceae bacterium]